MINMNIVVTKSGLMIYPYTKGTFPLMEKYDSVYDKIYHTRHEVSGFIVPYSKTDNCYLTYYRNPSQFKGDNVNIITQNFTKYRRMSLENEMSLIDGISPTELQNYVLENIIGGNSIDKLLYNQWFLNLPTSSGKTLTSLYFASLVKYKTLIICPNKTILNQWINTLDNKFIISSQSRLIIKNSKILDKIIEDNEKFTDVDIYICTSTLINSFSNKRGWGELNPLFEKMGIGLLIIDEAHLHMGLTIRVSAATNVKYTLFLSADYGRGNYDEERRFLSLFAKTPVIRPTDEMLSSFKNTVAIVVEFNSQPTPMEKQYAIYNRYGFSSNAYISYQIKKGVIFRVLKFVIESINKTNYDHSQTVILCTNIDPINDIAHHLKQYFPDKMIIRYHGNVPEEEKAMVDDADIIVATYLMFSTGIDKPRIKYIIGTNQSNKIEDNQTAGRAGRTQISSNTAIETYYIMLIDVAFAYCKNKLTSRINYLKEKKLKKCYKVKYYEN